MSIRKTCVKVGMYVEHYTYFRVIRCSLEDGHLPLRLSTAKRIRSCRLPFLCDKSQSNPRFSDDIARC